MAEVGVAFVSIVPSARGFGSKLNSQVGPAAATAGAAGGKQYGGRFKSAAASALKGFGAIFAGATIAKGFTFAISEASNLSESINAVKVSYGKAADEILKIGQNSAKGFGLSKAEFNGFAVQFQSFSKTIAGAKGDVPKTFESIIGRARDFASVMNLEVGQAAELFQSGLAGETEPLRKFGIDLSAAKVEAFAYAEGIAKAGKPLTEQQKIQARYALLMKQTSKTQGDFKNTSNGLANQQRILKAQFKNTAAAVGGVVVPALAKFFTILTTKVGPGLKKVAGFIKSNSTTFKIIAGVIAALLVPSLIVATATLIANSVAWAANAVAMGIATVWIRAYQIAAKLGAAAQWLLNAAMSANPIGLIVIAIIALVAGIVLLWKKSETFRTIIIGLWNAIKTAFSAGIAFVKEHWRAFLAALLAILFGPIGLIVGLIIANWGKIKAATIAVWNAIKGFFRSVWNGIKAVFWAVVNAIVNFLKTRWNNLKNNTVAAFNLVKSIITKVMNAVKTFISNRINDVIGFFKKLPGRVKTALGDLGKTLLNAGKKLIQGFIDGIQKKFKDVKNKLGELGGKLTSWKGPPSKDKVLLTKNGQLIIEGLIRGFESRKPAVRQSLQGMTSTIGSLPASGFAGPRVAGLGSASSIPDMPIVDGSQVIGYLRDVATQRARIELAAHDRQGAITARMAVR